MHIVQVRVNFTQSDGEHHCIYSSIKDIWICVLSLTVCLCVCNLCL